MKITYATTYDASDIHSWSGTGHYILRTLQNNGFNVETIGPLKSNKFLMNSVRSKLYSLFYSKSFLSDREPNLLKSLSAQVDKKLLNHESDVVVSPGSIPIAYLKTDKPVVFWTDATFAGMVNFYPGFSNLCKRTINNGNRMEQLALAKCKFAIYSSEWAAKTAIEHYNVDPQKVRVVPFGANIECNRTLVDVRKIAENKNYDVCKLLFIGVDWDRKGGAAAVSVAKVMADRGHRVELHVVGCKPPGNLPSFVIQHGFISKQTTEGQALIDQLIAESHFLILPTKADCVPVVFAEASSFGTPSLGTNVGGIDTAIRSGKNGQTFDVEAEPSAYCDYIESIMYSKDGYVELALSTFQEYSERLSWRAAGASVTKLLKECGQ